MQKDEERRGSPRSLTHGRKFTEGRFVTLHQKVSVIEVCSGLGRQKAGSHEDGQKTPPNTSTAQDLRGARRITCKVAITTYN